MSTDKPTNPANKSNNVVYVNSLKQQSNQKAPIIVWVSDITYIKAANRWYYLCVVMDLFYRKIIAWHISPKPDVELVMDTFPKAYEKRKAPFGLMFHSDRGSQYTAFAFRKFLDSLNVLQFFSQKDRIALLICKRQTRLKTYIGSITIRLFTNNSF